MSAVASSPECHHYWMWQSPAGSSHSARLCMGCGAPDPEWLDEIYGLPGRIAQAIETTCLSEHHIAPDIDVVCGRCARTSGIARAAETS